jgi:hypothetical protein
MTEICTNCGAQVAKAIKERTWKPTTAGILCIIAGAICVVPGIAVALLFAFMGTGWLSAIGAPLIILGIIAIVGGIYSLRRRIWGLALAGSICALIGGGFGILGILGILAFVALGGSDSPSLAIPGIFDIILSPWSLIGFIVGFGILGILAIIFVIMGKREFE